MSINGYDLSVLLNTNGILELIAQMNVRSVIQCAAPCIQTDNCTRATFGASRCRLLQDKFGESVPLINEKI